MPPAAPPSDLDQDLALLTRMADLGMEILEAITAQAKGGPQVVSDIGMAHGRVTRALRLTLLLRKRLKQDAAAQHEFRAVAAKQARKDQVEAIVTRVICENTEDESEAIALADDARDRLDDETLYADVMTRPVSDLVAAICHDLGVTPDWAALATEAWAQTELAGEEVGEALQEFSATMPPPLAGEGDREAVERAFGGSVVELRTEPRPCAGMPSPSAALTPLPPAGEAALE